MSFVTLNEANGKEWDRLTAGEQDRASLRLKWEDVVALQVPCIGRYPTMLFTCTGHVYCVRGNNVPALLGPTETFNLVSDGGAVQISRHAIGAVGPARHHAYSFAVDCQGGHSFLIQGDASQLKLD